jgi:ATP-dependent Clp endopeptidase proteolytic subunit ClpP
MAQLNNRKQKPGGGSWYSISAKDTGPVEVFIYEEIGGWGIGAAEFVKDLRAHKGKDISLRLHTPGGSVFDGNAIYNALKNHAGKVTTSIDGWALSIGSLIALAGDTVKMAENALYMIHNPWGLMAGDAEEMRKTADLLDKIKATMAKTYAEKSGKDIGTIDAWMNEETYFTAQEAKDAGFCDEIGDEMKLAACAKVDFKALGYKHPPEKLVAEMMASAKPQNERELEAVLQDAGYSRSEARAVVVRGYKGIGQRDAGAAAKVAAYEIINLLRA